MINNMVVPEKNANFMQIVYETIHVIITINGMYTFRIWSRVEPQLISKSQSSFILLFYDFDKDIEWFSPKQPSQNGDAQVIYLQLCL